jgi:hypothetical protein
LNPYSSIALCPRQRFHLHPCTSRRLLSQLLLEDDLLARPYTSSPRRSWRTISMDRQLLEDDLLHPRKLITQVPGRQSTPAQIDPRLGAPEDKLPGQAAPRAGAPGGRSPHPYSSCRTVSSYQASHHPGAPKGQYPRPGSSWRTVLLLPRHLIAQVLVFVDYQHPGSSSPNA